MDHLRQLLDPMGHFPLMWLDLIRDLINFGADGSLDINIVLSDLLMFRIIYPPKYFCNFTQLFQNNISVFSKVSNYTHCLSQAAAQVGYLQRNRYYFEAIV